MAKSDERSRKVIGGGALSVGLAGYILLALFLSYCQRGRINADFIGYDTVAHRVLEKPSASISGQWSPLFSWCISGLISLGIPDLVAGRAILVAAGALYVVCVYRVASRFRSGAAGPDRFLMIGTLTCAVVQAACWAIYLLDPDLLAAALFFAYADCLLETDLPNKPERALAGGLAGGLSYLSKAYMFPFIILHLPVTLAMRRRQARDGNWIAIGAMFLAGLAICVAPWGAVLSRHFHRFTLSTAGASNHANLSPQNDGLDLLFNPGLVPDYIFDPHLGPDWSPFQNWANFRHQLALLAKNLNVILGHFAPWFILVGIGIGLWAYGRRSAKAPLLRPIESFGVLWCLMTFILNCAGYTLLVVEARYVVPIGAPVLCIAAILMARSAYRAQTASSHWSRRWLQKPRTPVIIIVVLVFSGQQIQRLTYSAVYHAQTRGVAQLRPIADALLRFVPGAEPMACNRWHDGLAVAYLCNRIPTYLGTPVSADVPAELEAAHARVYLRLIERPSPAAPIIFPDVFAPGYPWILIGTVDDPAMADWTAEIYHLGPVKITNLN